MYTHTHTPHMFTHTYTYKNSRDTHKTKIQRKICTKRFRLNKQLCKNHWTLTTSISVPSIILNKDIPSKDHVLAPVRVTQTIIKNIAEASSATITCRSHQFSVGRRHEADLLFSRNITIKFNCLYFRFPYFRPFPEDRLLLEHNPGTAGYPEAPRFCSSCFILPEGKYSVLVCYLSLSKPQALKMPALTDTTS